jgi:hypothetical protein
LKTTAVPAFGAPAPVPPMTAASVAPPPIERSAIIAPQPVAEVPVKPLVPPEPPKPTLPPALADVFAALVTATSSEPAMPKRPLAAKKDAVAVTDDVINDVMRRVIAELSNRIVRETGPTLVSEIAERLVREEIGRIKSAPK